MSLVGSYGNGIEVIIIPKICQARITKVYKRKKSASTWPGYAEWDETLPVCGGNVTFTVELDGGGCCAGSDYCYCEPTRLDITPHCNKCDGAWYDGIFDITRGDTCSMVERMLNDG